MKIGVIGRGKMGKDIADFFQSNKIEIVVIGNKGDFSLLKNCEFTIETTHEDNSIKSFLHSKIKNIYSNTSFLKVDVPQIHFMNPANKNKIVEVTPDVDQKIIDLLTKLGKEVYVVPKIKGLIVNRVLMGGLQEYIRLKKIYGVVLDIDNLCKNALKYDYERITKFIGNDIVKIMSNEYGDKK